MQHGVIRGSAPYGVGLDETLMPEFLKEVGYASHIVGKVTCQCYTWNVVVFFCNQGSKYSNIPFYFFGSTVLLQILWRCDHLYTYSINSIW